MSIKLSERGLEAALNRDTPAETIQAYLDAIWLPIDEDAKTGRPMLLRLIDGNVAIGWWRFDRFVFGNHAGVDLYFKEGDVKNYVDLSALLALPMG